MDNLSWTRNEVSVSSGRGTVLLSILIMIVITNILNLITFKHMRRLQLQHYLIICLTIVDLVTVLPHLVAVVGYFQGFVVLNLALCQAIAIFNHTVIAATTWIHCGICIDKCASIIQPLAHREFVRKFQPYRLSTYFSVTVIVLTFALISGTSFGGIIKTEFNSVVASCIYDIDLSYCLIVGGFYIFIPLATALVTHILIINEIRKSNERRQKRIKRAIKTTALVVGIYYICYLPYLGCVIFQVVFPQQKMLDILEYLSVQLIILNSSMNFFILLICNKDFSQSLKIILHFKKSSEVNPEN